MEELRCVNELTPETMFIGFMYNLTRFAKQEPRPSEELSPFLQDFVNDSALFELGCYMYFRLDLWLFLRHQEHRPRVAGTIVREFKHLFTSVPWDAGC